MACKDYYESLMLEVMGEPDPENRERWEKHLDGCGACRSERARLSSLLQEMRKSGNPPELSDTEVDRFAQHRLGRAGPALRAAAHRHDDSGADGPHPGGARADLQRLTMANAEETTMRRKVIKFETVVCTALALVTSTTIAILLNAVSNMSIVA